jgi:hypothetical protein
MADKFFNSLPNFNSTSVNVDRENGVLKNTCIAQYGENKNDSFFDDLFLDELVKQGNATEKGIKSRFGHPNMCSTSFGSYIGRYKNFRNLESGMQGKVAVFADLYLDEITKKTQVEGKGITMFEYIVSMAENNPDMFGNSIHIFSEVYEKEIDGKKQFLHKLEKFKACDLVDDPAATDALFSDSKDLGILATQFLDNNPKLFGTIEKQPEIISDFFERYVNYQNRKSKINFNMNFFEKMKQKLAGKKDDAFDINITLGDGSIITVVTDATEPQVGDAVTDDTGAPLADDTYVLPDGGTIVVLAGVIDEITATEEPAEPGTEDPAPQLQEVLNSVNAMQKTVNELSKQFGETQKVNEATFELFAEKLNALGKNIKSKFEVPELDPTNKKKATPSTESVYDADKAKEIREKRTNK